MRGFTVVLYVAVLLSLLNVAAAACGANGDVSPFEASICICKSGFSGSACDTAASGCALSVVEPASDVADNFPKLNTTAGATEFRSNFLFASIVGDHVANRTYKELNFTNANSSKCSFGTASSYWTREFGCVDRFSLALPWTEHTSCGFVKDTVNTNDQFLVITNTLHLKYEDWVYINMGMNEETNETEVYKLERLVNIPYKMSVKFQKYINVTLLALNITSDVKFGAALTGDEYNPVDQTLTLTLTSIINYPNSFRASSDMMEFFAPNFVDIVPYNISGVMSNVWFKNVDTIGADCKYLDDEPCTQVWEVTLKLNQDGNCSFDGDYRLSLRLYTCRSPSFYKDQACTWTPAHINFTLSTNNVCGQIEIEPVVKGELIPYKHGLSFAADSGPPDSLKKSSFKLGEFGNFYARISSAGNDIKINFTDIRFQEKGQNDSWVYLMQDHVVLTADNKHLAKVVPDHAGKFFSLYFHSAVFHVPPERSITYTFSAWVDILFLGNEGEQKKRSVEYTFETDSQNVEANIALGARAATKPTVDAPAQAVKEGGIQQTTFVASVVGAIAGTMLIVFVVVGVALRSRNQSAKRDTAASAAIVAAGAAAQSIEVVSRV